MSFISKDDQLYRLTDKKYIIKDGKVYLKCKDWVNIEGKSMRAQTIVNYIESKKNNTKNFLDELIEDF